ncbi:hypothetical protein Q7P35_011959 [Cladosporium inversicolor]
MPSSAVFLRAGLALVSFTSTVFQQASAQSPTGTWKPRPSCQLGGDPSANNGLGGGIYVDKFGGQWDMRCSTGLTGTVVVAGTTNGQGIYGCAKGCAKRPSCIAFTYANSSLVAITDTTGSGPCSYRFIVGDYVLDTARPVTTYAAAVLIRANTQLPCPAFNGGVFTDSTGYGWQTYCNTNIDGGGDVSAIQTNDMLYCIAQCNAASTCNAFRYIYGGSNDEPTDATETGNPAQGKGMCYLKLAQGTAVAGASPTANWMSRIARAPYTSSAVSSSTVAAATGLSSLSSSSSDTASNVATSSPATTTTTTTTPAVPTTTTTTTTPGIPTTTTTTTTPAVSTTTTTTTTSNSASSFSSSAQAGVQTVTPTGTWKPGPTCSAGGDVNANGGLGGGGYVDKFGGLWDARCANSLPNGVPVALSGTSTTNGQGWYGCSKACAKRPGCTAFQFTPNYASGTVPRNMWGEMIGSGTCAYYTAAGAYAAGDPAILYGAAHLIRANTRLPCPASSGTLFVDASGQSWQTYCAVNMDSSDGASVNGVSTTDMLACMAYCDSVPDCNAFRYTYSGDEVKDADEQTNAGKSPPQGFAQCYLKRSGGTTVAGGSPTVNYMSRIARATGVNLSASASSISTSSVAGATSSSSSITAAPAIVTTTTTTTSSSSVSAATATCTNAPNPANLTTITCTSANNGPIGDYVNACGTRYTITCGQDTNPGSYDQSAAASINDCTLKCDASPRCKAAVFVGGACYFKAGFTSFGSPAVGKAALVRYILPNPNYAIPVAATGGGCGIPIPANLTANGPSVRFNMTPSDGVPRSFLIHIPRDYDVNKASPVIFAFHGNNAKAETIEQQTRINDPYTNPFAIAIYMQGVGTPAGWESNPDYGSTATNPTNAPQRDLQYVKELVPVIQNMFCIDSTRIFALGHSNGGGFCGALACDPDLSRIFAAIAPNAGAFYSATLPGADPSTVDTNTPSQPQCLSSKNMPIFETHGTGDGVISYFGGNRNGRTLPTIPHWMQNWVVRQGVSLDNYTTYPSARTTLTQWGNATGEFGRISHYRLEGWGHDWPTGDPIDFTPPMMEFFYRWTNPNRGLIYAPASNSLTIAPPTTTTTTTGTTSSATASSVSTTGSSSLQTGSATGSATGTGLATATAFPATCQADDRKRIVDAAGNAYQLLCSFEVTAVNGHDSRFGRFGQTVYRFHFRG